MPQINLAEDFDKRIAERLKMEASTDLAVNYNYKFDGADTVHITSVDTMPMNVYQKSGTNRYGTPLDIGDTEQVVTLSQDYAFTGIIDKGDVQDQKIQKSASDCLRRQTDEVINPKINKYRLAAMANKPGFVKVDTELATVSGGAANIYADVLDLGVAATNGYAPFDNRIIFCIPEVIAMLLQSDGKFLQYGDRAQEYVIKGVIGELDGAKFVRVPKAIMPDNCALLLGHKDATTAVEKLKDFTIHENPPGVNGNLIEGRIKYDAFVLDTKVSLIGAVYSAGTLCTAPTITYTGGSTNTIAMTAGSGETIKYTLDGSDPRTSPNVQTYSAAISTSSYAAANGSTVIKAYSTKTGNINSVVSTTVIPVATTLTRYHGNGIAI